MTQGLPDPAWLIVRSSLCAGQSTCCRSPLGNLFQSTRRAWPATATVVFPETGVLSNAFANFSMASTPHAFATVKSHAPCRWRPNAPRTSRGISSFHCGMFSTDKTNRTAFTSLETMSHQR